MPTTFYKLCLNEGSLAAAFYDASGVTLLSEREVTRRFSEAYAMRQNHTRQSREYNRALNAFVRARTDKDSPAAWPGAAQVTEEIARLAPA